MASFVVKKKSSGTGWKLHRQVYVEGARSEPVVPVEAYHALGFSPTMSLEEARGRAKQLNAQKSLDEHKAAKAATRVHVEQPLIESAYLPAELVAGFTTWIEQNSSGSAVHTEKLLTHWRKVQLLISEMQLDEFAYSDNARRIYRYFEARKYSLDYSNKLLRILNQWGRFVCRKRGQYYQDVESPRGQFAEAINEANDESKFARKGGSTRMTPERLLTLQGKLKPAQFNWVEVSLYFGLRPSEVEGLSDPKRWRVEVSGALSALHVYQPKLKGLSKERRWKRIPCKEPEQIRLLDVIRTGALERPLAKTLKKYLDDERVSLYAGRKGFTDLMLARGHKFEDISAWLGHQSIDRTWRNYKDKLTSA